ncbi:uncharacterized protein LOC123670642 [Harmonia axyridis]|uniref:uncharacterized protein LOC123670642 n=1 Tax=Harmonia axyridis TaxID=115357 RepID=UPI001E2798E5|nr:uncharacterized protein LOC123670642 [Harmonia axyridis]
MSDKVAYRYLSFSNMEDYNLINIVQQHRILYDINHKDHRDFGLRAKLWNDIAEKMDRSVEECKRRWRNMKDTYFRFKRKNLKSSWILAKRLKFLDSAGRNMRRIENNSKVEEMPVAADEDLTQSHHELDSLKPDPYPYELSSNSDKINNSDSLRDNNFIKLIEQKQEEQDLVKTDPIFAFFHSMALSVKKMPPELVAEAKVKICELVGSLELRAIRMEHPIDASNLKEEVEEISIYENR